MKTCAAILVLVLAGASGAAAAQDDSDGWQFSLTPYLWLPTIDGALKYSPPSGGGSPTLEVGPTDWLDLLNIGALISGSARKGRYSISSDFVYLSLTSENDGRVISVEDNITVPGVPVPIPISASLNLNTRTDLDGLVWMIAAGYALQETETSSLDVFVGARYFSVDVTSSWDLTADVTTPGGTVVLPAQGSIASDVDIWDGIIGVRGYSKVGSGKWSVPYYVDVGAGDSDLTWNAMIGMSREFGWGELVIAYRHLDYDQDVNGLLQNFSFSGPGIGARFNF
jgi:hypothetical protein